MAKDEQEEHTMEFTLAKTVLFSILGIVLLIAFFTSWYIVSAGQRAVLVTLGNPSSDVITEGLHFKVPFFQSAVIMDIKTQKDEVETSSASKDLQIVTAKVAVNYHLEGTSAPRIYKEVGLDYVNRILSPAIQETIKASTAQFTAEELITKRELVRESIKILIQEKMRPRGIVIEDVLITNFDFSKSFNEAIENKVTTEQNALAAKNKLAQVQYEAQQTVAAAEGQAQAIKIQVAAINSQGGVAYVQLQAINKWSGTLPLVVGGNSLSFINIPTGQSNLSNSNSS